MNYIPILVAVILTVSYFMGYAPRSSLLAALILAIVGGSSIINQATESDAEPETQMETSAN